MPRKGENIYKRKDGRWEGRYIKERDNDNKAKYGYLYARTYSEVKKKLNCVYAETHCTVVTTPGNTMVFHILAEEWLQMSQSQIKESTSVKYQNLLKDYIIPYMGEKKIEEITFEQMDMFCKELLQHGGIKEQGLSPKTVSDTISLLKNILKYAELKGITTSCNHYTIKTKHKSEKMKVFSNEEQEKLCQYLFENQSVYNMGILLCLFTGIRIGELCALEWKDISISNKTIYIHQTMQRIQSQDTAHKTKITITSPKSSCSIRTIPLPDNLVTIIDSFFTQKNGYFLIGKNNDFVEPRIMQNHFKKVLKEAGIAEANFHVLRHTFATRCVELGFDVKSLSVLLGHASVNITMNRYVHPSMHLKRENMQRLSALISVK